MIRRHKSTIFTDAKENTTVTELKKVIEGKSSSSPHHHHWLKISHHLCFRNHQIQAEWPNSLQPGEHSHGRWQDPARVRYYNGICKGTSTMSIGTRVKNEFWRFRDTGNDPIFSTTRLARGDEEHRSIEWPGASLILLNLLIYLCKTFLFSFFFSSHTQKFRTFGKVDHTFEM